MIDSRFLTSRDAEVNGDLPLAPFDAEASAKTFNEIARKVQEMYSRNASAEGKPLRWALKHVDISNQAPYFLGSQLRQFLSKILYLTPNRPGERVNVSISPRWLLCSPGELFGEDLAEVIDEQISYLEYYAPNGCLSEDELEAAYAKKEKYFVLFDHPFETCGSGVWVNVTSGNTAEFVLNRNRPLATLSKADIVWKPLQPMLESWLAAMSRDDWRLFAPGPLLKEPYYHTWQVEEAVSSFHRYLDLLAVKVKAATGGSRGNRIVDQKALPASAVELVPQINPVNRYICMHDSFYGEEWNEKLAAPNGGGFAKEFLSSIDCADFRFIAPGIRMPLEEDIRKIAEDQKRDSIRLLFPAAEPTARSEEQVNGHHITNGASNTSGARAFLLRDHVNRVTQLPGIYCLSGDREAHAYVVTDALLRLNKSHEQKPEGTSFHKIGRSGEGRSCILPTTLPEIFQLFERNIGSGRWTVGPDGVSGSFADLDS